MFPSPFPIPLDAFGVSILGAFSASTLEPPTFQTKVMPLTLCTGMYNTRVRIMELVCRILVVGYIRVSGVKVSVKVRAGL